MAPTEKAPSEEELHRLYELMEQRVADRTLELSTLLTVQQAISSRLEMQDVLQMIADGARQLTGGQFAGVYLLEGEKMRLAVMSVNINPGALEGPPPDIGPGYTMPFHQSLAQTAVEAGKPILVSDVSNDPRVYREVVERTGIRSFIVVPLMAGKRPVGLLTVADSQPGGLTEEDERILTLLAVSAVIGLENASLYRQAEEHAALAERTRLARDLHDAVTQSLFASNLIAEALPKIWERDPWEGLRRLEELRQSTRGALAEMRSLLLELRPAALEQAEIGELMKHLANAFAGRTKTNIDLHIEGDDHLPNEVKICLYRIAQEALNNIAKHAGADRVSLHLLGQPGHFQMDISDNGVGFDPTMVGAEHLGLRIMRERVEAIGASLSVYSRPGDGTRIKVVWSSEKKTENNGP